MPREISAPWKVCYANEPFLVVVQHPFVRDDGKAGLQSRAIVVDGSLAIALDRETHQVVMIERERDRPEGKIYVMEPPGGAIDEGDTPLVCARKELREETGFMATDWIQLYSDDGVTPIDGLIWTRQHLFLALDAIQVGDPVGDETKRVVLKTFSELIELVRRNKFHDPLMTNALWFAYDWLGRNKPDLIT